MNTKQKGMMVFFVLVILISLSLKFYFDLKESGYGKITMIFEEINEVQVGTSIDPIELIKKTNAEEIKYPIIDTSEIGIHELFYIGSDNFGNERVFVFELNVVSSVFPRLTLIRESDEIMTGERFDAMSYIQECKDETDGSLEAKVDDIDTSKPGHYNINYLVSDRDGHTSTAVLALTIKEKEVVPVPNPPHGIDSPVPPLETPPIAKEEELPPTLPVRPIVPDVPLLPMQPHEKWLFDRGEGQGGYTYEGAFKACKEFGSSNSLKRFECLPISNDGEPIGYQINY